jgi:hypothetical protein
METSQATYLMKEMIAYCDEEGKQRNKERIGTYGQTIIANTILIS